MILQYKGFNNNWCYEEAETIIAANVWIGKVTKDHRIDGAKYKAYLGDLQKCISKEEKEALYLKHVKEVNDEVDKFIKKETNCCDDIVYFIDGRFDNMENVTVVTLKDKNKAVTYVFGGGVYLLNNRGQTVQKLA